VATRDQVLGLLELGYSYETAARELKIPAGLAFMIATGLPADGSDVPSEQDLAGKCILPGSSQQLVNPPAFNPTRKEQLTDWARERAARELKRAPAP
jgi:hypothetical protein